MLVQVFPHVDFQPALGRLGTGNPAVGGALELEGAVECFRAFQLARAGVDDEAVLHEEVDGLLRIKNQQATLFPGLRQTHERFAKGSE